jgi:hypothetical protein
LSELSRVPFEIDLKSLGKDWTPTCWYTSNRSVRAAL